ncbi:MAG TPA: DUF4136 domain-containing protein [Steroidobacteraceae bacterium]|nr:DUF4136 domain-containing protein [Steroidobacteraceae bacterium]
MMLTTLLRTRRLAAAAALVATALLASGCASGPDIRADYDRQADFGKYRTFGFVAATSTDTAEFRTLATQMMQAAATREMQARGYTRADDPDLLINFKGKLEEKTDIESTPAPYYGPGWGYRGWYGAPYGAYGYGGSEVTTRRYNVGTLVMDVIDRENRQAVFQGGIEGVVTKDMMANKEATIDQAVTHIFSKYPFVAGQSAPVVPVDEKKK